MIKLYKRSERQIHYWEAWEHDDKIVFHWGVVGETGQTSEHWPTQSHHHHRVIEEEAGKRRAEGYSEITIEDHRTLIVQYRTQGWEPALALEKRRKVEELLNEWLGWTGNGHCDGGDIGGGTINVFLLVVDAYLATKTIIEALKKTRLLSGATIALENEDGFDILWPHDVTREFTY